MKKSIVYFWKDVLLEFMEVMKYYCIKQHDITDCGAACLGDHFRTSVGYDKL